MNTWFHESKHEFQGQEHGRARWDYVTVVKSEIACDPDASNGRVRDVPARPNFVHGDDHDADLVHVGSQATDEGNDVELGGGDG